MTSFDTAIMIAQMLDKRILKLEKGQVVVDKDAFDFCNQEVLRLNAELDCVRKEYKAYRKEYKAYRVDAVSVGWRDCDTCKHSESDFTGCSRAECKWEWRGVTEKEETHE